MSAEILGNSKYFTVSQLREDGPVVHSAIHDLESFFWVLLYLCLTRSGPGGERRDELQPNAPDQNDVNKLHRIVGCLFEAGDNDTLLANKRRLFENPRELDQIITPCFHPYFADLGNLVVEWWNVIRFGYHTLDHVAPGIIHDQVIKLIDDERMKIEVALLEGPTSRTQAGASNKEVERRKNDLQRIEGLARGLAVVEDSTPTNTLWELSPDRVSSSTGSYATPSSPTPPSKRQNTGGSTLRAAGKN